MTKLQKTRLEVERELDRRSARIDGAVTRLKKDISGPGVFLGRFARKYPYESLFGVVAVGAAAAFLVLNRSGSRPSKPTGGRTGVADAYADLIAKELQEAGDGYRNEDALRAAIRANPPVVIPPQKSQSPDYARQITDKFVNTVTAVAFEYATRWLTELTNRRNGSS